MRRLGGSLLIGFAGAVLGGGVVGEPVIGFVAGAIIGMVALRREEGASPPVRRTNPDVIEFITRAVADGVIGKNYADRLLAYHRHGTVAASPATGEEVAAAPPPAAPSGATRPTRPAGPKPPVPRAAPRPRPVPAVSWEPVKRPPREPSPLAIGFRRLGRSTGALWKAFSADVAIHSVIYLGVLLLGLVMFAFFGLGFYGDIVRGDQWRPWRPVVAAALPAAGFGVAALLRNQTGIPFTANAIGFLASLSLPIMLASLFQDGAPWGPPDLDGASRWFGYAVVGLVSAAIFLFASRRSTMYAYLVGPGIWVAAGALGLFLEDGIPLLSGAGVSSYSQFTSDGISWAQMAFVLGAMALTLVVVRVRPHGPVAPRIVRSGIVCLPLVAGFGAAFAALDGGTPLEATAAPTTLLLSTGAVAFAARGSGFAWEGMGERLRAWIRGSLSTTGVAVVAAGWVATGLLGVDIPWIGAGLALYAAALLVAGERVVGDSPVALAGLRLVGAAGMITAAFDPWPAVTAWTAATLALAGAEPSVVWRQAWSRVAPMRESIEERAWIIAAAAAVAVSGAARLGWEEATAWTVLAAGLALAAARWLPARAAAVRALSARAPWFALAGVAVAAYRWLELGSLDRPGFGVHLLAAGLVVAVSSIDWLVRFPAVVAALVPGAALALRYFDVPGSILDAAVTAVVGAALLGGAAVLSRRLAVEAEILAHLLLWASPLVGSPSDSGLMIGLFAVAVTHLTAAVVLDRGWATTSLAGPLSTMTSAVGHAVVGVVTLPVVAVLATRELPWFAAERPRSALVMAAAAWLYSIVVTMLERTPVRRLIIVASHLLGLLAIAVAVPSNNALIVTTWSAALGFGWHALRARSPVQSLPAWVMALAASMLTAARLGISRADIHEPLFVGAVMLIALGAAAHRRGGGLRAWGLPPLGLGLLVMPAALAFVIADQVRIGQFALAAAAVYAGLLWLLHTGAFAPLVAGMLAVAYADLLPVAVSPFDHPLIWLPFAAALFAISALQPARERTHWLAAVTPGLVFSWLAVLGLAGAVAADTNDLPWVLLASAGLVAASGLRWQSITVGYAALALVGLAGLAAGPGWLAGTLLFDALMVGLHATWRADLVARTWLAPLAAVLGAGAFAALGVWRQWSADEALAATAVAALLTGVAAVALSSLRVGRRLAIWEGTAHGLAQVAVVAFVAIGFDAFSAPDEYGPVAAALAFEAALWGVLATVGRLRAGVWAATALAGAAVWSAAEWLDLAAWEAIGVVGGAAVLAAGAGVVFTYRGVTTRAALWRDPALGVSQLGGIVVAGIAVESFGTETASGVAALVLAAEAVLLGSLAGGFPAEYRLRSAAMVSACAAALFGVGSIADSRTAGGLLVGLGFVGALMMVAGSRPASRLGGWVEPALVGGWLLAAAVPVMTGVRTDSDLVLVTVLVIGGAGIVLGAITAGRWRASYLGMLEWALAVFIGFGQPAITDANVVVAPVAAVVLGILALERLRARLLSQPLSRELLDLIALVELVAMVAPLLTAGWPAYEQRSLVHLALLLGEATALVVWALFTRVRRRLAVGAVGLVAVVVYPIAQVLASAIRGGLSGGSVLAIGAGVALVLIVVGSLLERSRVKLGEMVRRLGEALEDWS
jgi:hypothetical protein